MRFATDDGAVHEIIHLDLHPTWQAAQMLRPLQPEDKDDVLLLAAQTFIQHEPMTRAGGKALPELLQLFGPITEACCCSGMSFLVEQQGTIVAVSLALPFAQYNAVQWPDVPRPAQVILRTLPKLTAQQEAVSVYMFLWATRGDHMGKGYAKAAVAASLQAAGRAGYRSAVADLTNVASQQLAMGHFGFEAMEPKARYHDHELYRAVEGSEYIIRAVKDLGTAAGGVSGWGRSSRSAVGGDG